MGNYLYSDIYSDLWKRWGGFYDLNYTYGRGILAKIINMGLKIVIFRLKNIDLGAKFGKSYYRP